MFCIVSTAVCLLIALIKTIIHSIMSCSSELCVITSRPEADTYFTILPRMSLPGHGSKSVQPCWHKCPWWDSVIRPLRM